MHDIGSMTHEQLEKVIADALERISSLEGDNTNSAEISFAKEEW